MDLPANIRKQFQAYGRRGGRLRAERLSPLERENISRTAVMVRWIRRRFGAPTFEELGIPGGKLVDRGLRDYATGRVTKEACTVALAASRLRREGVPVPHPPADWRRNVPDPHETLYRLIEKENEELAHARYNAFQREIVSFADALAQTT